MKPEPFVVSLKSVTVLTQSIEICLYNLNGFLFVKGLLLKLAFDEFFPQGIVIDAVKDKIVVLLIGAVASHI